LFKSIINRETDLKVPSYDKSKFFGEGDRRPESEWEVVNRSGEKPVEVVIFEGWCVGFRALKDGDAEAKWKAAKEEFGKEGEGYDGRLGKLKLESVRFVNERLREYDGLTE